MYLVDKLNVSQMSRNTSSRNLKERPVKAGRRRLQMINQLLNGLNLLTGRNFVKT